MTINKFTGKTKEEAIECAKQAFGPNAVIMNIKEIKPKGLFGIFKSSTYEVTAAMDEKKQTITTSQLARTTLPGKIDYKADEEIKMPSFAPKSASETLKPTPAPAAPKAAEQTSDIEQEIKELDSIAKMMESTFDNLKKMSHQSLKVHRSLNLSAFYTRHCWIMRWMRNISTKFLMKSRDSYVPVTVSM